MSWKVDAVGFAAVTDSSDSGEISFKIPVTESDLDKKPAARQDPIKDNPTLKAPITGSHLGKRLRQSESRPTTMNPVVNTVVTELNFIGQGGPRAIRGGTHTQSIIEGRENIVYADFITHIMTNPTQVCS